MVLSYLCRGPRLKQKIRPDKISGPARGSRLGFIFLFTLVVGGAMAHFDAVAADQAACVEGLTKLESMISGHFRENKGLGDWPNDLTRKMRSLTLPPCSEESVVNFFSKSPLFRKMEVVSKAGVIWFRLGNPGILVLIQYLQADGSFPLLGRYAKVRKTEEDFE